MRVRSAAFLFACAAAAFPHAVHAGCAQPVTSGDRPTATDCLFVLKAAVGSEDCDPCLCDADASGGVVATDALVCLRFAVGQNVTLACEPCSGTTHKESIVAPPVIRVAPLTPQGGGQTTIAVSADGASEIALTFDGDGCGDFTDVVMASEAVEIVHAAGAFGACRIAAAVTTGEVTAEHLTRFEVVPVALVLPAIDVLGGTFVPGEIPQAVGDAPQIDEIAAPPSIINGGIVEIRLRLVDPSAAANVVRVLVAVPTDPEFPGHFTVPAELDGDELVVKVRLDREAGQDEASFSERAAWLAQNLDDGDFVDFIFALIDNAGNISPTLIKQLLVALVSTADVQISLSWNTATDLDLHLIEPSNEEIYYGNATSAAGGVLDLDSNAGCEAGGNAENITYPGAKPPPGDYIVRVDFYSNCEDEGARYTLTRTVCGDTEFFSGSFAPGEEDFGGQGSGREITRFTVACDYRVRGTAAYEDFGFTDEGMLKASRMFKIRYAQVEVHRASDDAVLAKGSVKQDGTFDLSFENDGPPGYIVVVKTKQDDAFLKQQVQTAAGEVYSVASDIIDETVVPDLPNLSIEAKENAGAEAFNIFDMGVDGAALFRRVTGKTPPFLRWVWDDGASGLCPNSVSCYSAKATTISVTSRPNDPDEYDDLVLLHEYGHFFIHQFSRQDSRGGFHDARFRVEPVLAWAEGAATFFGNTARGSSVYVDTAKDGLISVVRDLDEAPEAVPRGTEDGTQTGDLSTAVVTGILWDLADAENETMDTVTNEQGVFAALAYLKSDAFIDRGVEGVDLVDFLDGWFCKQLGERGDNVSGVEGIVRGLFGFNYDYAEQDLCS